MYHRSFYCREEAERISSEIRTSKSLRTKVHILSSHPVPSSCFFLTPWRSESSRRRRRRASSTPVVTRPYRWGFDIPILITINGPYLDSHVRSTVGSKFHGRSKNAILDLTRGQSQFVWFSQGCFQQHSDLEIEVGFGEGNIKKGIHPQMQWLSYVTQSRRLINVMMTEIHQVDKVYHFRAKRQMAQSIGQIAKFKRRYGQKEEGGEEK